MSYSDLYRSAMNKVTTSDGWKTETLQKMQEEQEKRISEKTHRRKPALTVWKKAAMPLAAAAAFALLIIPYALRRPAMFDSGAMVSQAMVGAPFAAEDSPRTAPQPAALDAEAAPPPCVPFTFGAGCVVSAGSAEAALPPGTTFLKTSKIDDATLQNALAQLDEQLTQDKESGLLSYSLSHSNVLASGVLNATDAPTIVFVLPASDPSLYADNVSTLDYLIYAVDVSA